MSLPLQGRTVVLTRAQEQQGEGRQRMEALGASVIDLPALVIGPPDEWGPLDDALAELDEFHWLVFSSANGVNAVEERLQRQGEVCLDDPAASDLPPWGARPPQDWKSWVRRRTSCHPTSLLTV